MADSLLRSQISSPCSTTALLSPFSIYSSSSSSSSSSASASGLSAKPPRLAVGVPFSSVRLRHSQSAALKVHAQEVATESQNREPKWWERNAGPNMIDVHSTQEFLDALKDAGDRLVIVEFYGTWCASCKALFPKLCRLAREHPDILFLKVNFDENKPMCKRLNVRVLPYFHFYRGADGQLESFSCSLVKFQKIKDAIATHNTDRCSIGPPVGVGDLNLLETPSPQEKPAEPSSI